MTDPSDRRTLLNELTRLHDERKRLHAEYLDAADNAELIKIRVATADHEWKRIAAEWDDLVKPRDGGTIADNASVFSKRERVAAERLRIYPELAASRLELLSLDFRLSRLDIALNNLVADIYEIGRRLDETDAAPG